jgi:hypothetical protein
VTKVGFTPRGDRVVVGTDTDVATYPCELCGNVQSLKRLIGGRLPVRP